MKKNTLTILALVIALCALILSCVSVARLNARIETLETYTASLIAQVQQLAGRNESFFSTSDDAVSTTLVVESWTGTPDNLTITDGYVQVLLPQVAAPAPDSILVLKRNGEPIATQALALTADPTGAAFDAELRGVSFDLPALAGDDLLELCLDVIVSGETYSFAAAEWYLENGQLLMSAG